MKIEINDMTYGYPGNSNLVFDHLNLTLEENRIYGLLGKNGMGKSTLLYLIAGLLRPKAGTVEVDGKNASERRPEVLREIFMVPEEFDMPKMSMKLFTNMMKDFYPHFNEEVLQKCFNDFELPEDVDLKRLSMGQKKKVFMSFALASGCKLMLMDEPTNGLDIPSKSLFRKVIAQNMQDDSTLIISTHQVHDVESLLDHILLLNDSKLLLNAEVSDIIEKYSFGFRRQNEMDEDVLYSEPTLQGNAVVTLRNEYEQETQLNLELLFNAITKEAI